MKFLASLFVATVSVISLNTVAIHACEEDCRYGIASLFCDKYALEWSPVFDSFGADLKRNFYKGLDVTKLVGSQSKASKLKDAVDNAVSKQVKKLKSDYTKSCQAVVHDSIFLHEPKFKGQCQRPLKVVQPPVGVAWTLQDCEKQDYICGNPPAICHFMNQYVKPRNIKLLNEALSGRCSVDGDFLKTITDVAEDAAVGFFTNRKSSFDTFMTGIKKNIGNQLIIFVTNFKNKVCFVTKSNPAPLFDQTSCDKYDADIRTLLLSYP